MTLHLSISWCWANLNGAVSLAFQDELTTTKRSYEDQLSMMSDHLCSMNETLSKQREEIDTLKLASKVCSLTGMDGGLGA